MEILIIDIKSYIDYFFAHRRLLVSVLQVLLNSKLRCQSNAYASSWQPSVKWRAVYIFYPPRACGSASLALLNMILVLKDRLGIHDDRTAYDEMRWIQEETEEKENAVQPENLMSFIDNHPIFKSCRMLVMNPNGMNEEVFLRIFLRRLIGGDLVLAMMEIPNKKG